MNRNQLFSRLERSMILMAKEMYNDRAIITDCSPAQNHVLMVVGMHGAISVKQLAEKLRVTSGAATQHIDALEKVGLLSRNMSPNDRREVVVETTAKGQEAFVKVSKAKTEMLSKLFSELGDKELETLVELIEKASQKFISLEGENK